MPKSMGRWAVLLLVLIAGGAPAVAQTPVRLVLDFAIQGQQSPIVLAQEDGYFSRGGVEVRVDRGYGSADSITKVATGTYDMAFADVGALILFDSAQGSAKLIDVFQVYDSAPMVILSLAEALQASIANRSMAIDAIAKRDPLVDKDLERHRLDLVIANAIETDHIKQNGLGAVDMSRMQQTIDLITSTYKRPAMRASDLYISAYLPPGSDLKLP